MKATYLNHYLSDMDVANFARQSFGKLAENFTEAQNNNLIQFLARGMSSKDWERLVADLVMCRDSINAHHLIAYCRSIPEHWVPFGHPQISIRMQAPVPIARQCFKHKVGFVESEESRRYISTTPEIYVPPFLRAKADNVKQGSSNEAHPDSAWLLDTYQRICREAVQAYEGMINMGVCPEQARFVLPQGTEVNWVWTGSLYAFANAYNQRSDSHAQKEVQDLFAQVDQIIAPLYPVSWQALTQGKY